MVFPNLLEKAFFYKDDFPQVGQGERLIPSSCYSGTSLPPSPIVILPNPQVLE